MYQMKRNAFTMIELVFAIAIIGILSAIAIPKFAATRDDAVVSKGISTLAAVRSSIATERQKRILRGDFTAITDLSSGGGVFDTFSADGTGTKNRVLEYPPSACAGGEKGCWTGSGATYTYKLPTSGTCVYTLANNRLDGTCSEFGD